AEPVSDRLALLEVARRFRAGLVEVFERRSAELELARGLEADGPVGPGQRDDIAILQHRLPAELGQAQQQVADPAFFLPRWRTMVVAAIDEFLMLGADAPALGRLLAAAEDRQQIVAAFDPRAIAGVGALGHLGLERSTNESRDMPFRWDANAPWPLRFARSLAR